MLHEVDQKVQVARQQVAAKKIKFNELLKVILPILEFLVPVLFFKPKWQQYLKAFISAAHVITPQSFEDEIDTDGDGIPDWQDEDADGDGITDPTDQHGGEPGNP